MTRRLEAVLDFFVAVRSPDERFFEMLERMGAQDGEERRLNGAKGLHVGEERERGEEEQA